MRTYVVHTYTLYAYEIWFTNWKIIASNILEYTRIYTYTYCLYKNIFKKTNQNNKKSLFIFLWVSSVSIKEKKYNNDWRIITNYNGSRNLKYVLYICTYMYENESNLDDVHYTLQCVIIIIILYIFLYNIHYNSKRKKKKPKFQRSTTKNRN